MLLSLRELLVLLVLCIWIIFQYFFVVFKKSFRMSNSFNQDWAQPFVGTDLGQNCLEGYQQMTIAGKELSTNNVMYSQPSL